MWWLAIPPAVAVGAYVVKKIFEEDVERYIPPPKNYTPLECNFLNLEKLLYNNKDMKKIAIIGQPGAGKSAMLSGMTQNQCIPRPVIGQKTDATFWHIRPLSNFFNSYQNYKFVDAPGYDTYLHPVGSYLKYFPFTRFDFILLVIKDKIHGSDEKIFSKLEQTFGSSISKKVAIIRSFSDHLSDEDKLLIKNDFDKKFELADKNIRLFFLSNRYKYGINELKSKIFIS